MSTRTPFTQEYISLSVEELKASRVSKSLRSKNSLNQAGAEAVVVGVITEDPAAGTPDIKTAGLPIVIRRFNPTSAPFGYVVKIEEKAPVLAQIPTPNSAAYKNYIKALQKQFTVLHGANHPTANVGDRVIVRFNGPDYTGDGYIIQNLSLNATNIFAPAGGSVINYYGNGSEYVGLWNSSSATNEIWGPLLAVISKYESGKYGYEAIFGNFDLKDGSRPKPLTSMTIDEVINYARNIYYPKYVNRMKPNVRSSALGKYQQLAKYLEGRARKAGLDTATELFSPENQDKIVIAANIESGRGGKDFLEGSQSEDRTLDRLSFEFASFPDSKGNFQYGGQGKNGAQKVPEIRAALRECKRRYLENQQSSDELQASGVTETQTQAN